MVKEAYCWVLEEELAVFYILCTGDDGCSEHMGGHLTREPHAGTRQAEAEHTK